MYVTSAVIELVIKFCVKHEVTSIHNIFNIELSADEEFEFQPDS